MKTTSDKFGASVRIEEMTFAGYGPGSTEEFEKNVIEIRLTPEQCIEHALELLNKRIKPGALEVIKHFIRENRL